MRFTKQFTALFAASFLFAAAFMAGCGTTAQQTSYRAYATTQVSVDAAMTEWGAYVKSFTPPVAQEQAVKSAYEKWQAAMAVVGDAGAAYSAANGDTNLVSAAFSVLTTAVQNANTSQTDLINLLVQFGVTVK